MNEYDFATDGEFIYFYEADNVKSETKVHAMKYSIKENKTSRVENMLMPDAEKYKLNRKIYKIEDDLEMGIVKQRCSSNAWKEIEKIFYGQHYNWYVDQDAVYFSVQDDENPDKVVYKRIELKSGKVSESMSITHENGINPDMYTDMKINTRDGYRFDIHTYAGTQIYRVKNERKLEEYFLWWGFYYDKE